ncbi:hypothetical protein LSTR_LSTR015166 [Laodelphax striatellus]|uniref:Amino acid permease/ SLC12A domain-containing protein n=1 Tax=Laodelphax striatellus TaxID=195883 RepID=A0A482XIJ6_LAOST|nr:hypothetical protein LSTR_LSTR015166 [Laodelphax striatellus]
MWGTWNSLKMFTTKSTQASNWAGSMVFWCPVCSTSGASCCSCDCPGWWPSPAFLGLLSLSPSRLLSASSPHYRCLPSAPMGRLREAQNFLIVIIIAAIFDFLLGACLGPSSDMERVKGFSGLSTEVFEENWGPSYRKSEGDEQNFFTVFAIFFPSVTGIQAGANISGDLKVKQQ